MAKKDTLGYQKPKGKKPVKVQVTWVKDAKSIEDKVGQEKDVKNLDPKQDSL